MRYYGRLRRHCLRNTCIASHDMHHADRTHRPDTQTRHIDTYDRTDDCIRHCMARHMPMPMHGQTHTYTAVCPFTYIHSCQDIHMHTHMYVQTTAYTHDSTCICIHSDVYIHMHM